MTFLETKKRTGQSFSWFPEKSTLEEMHRTANYVAPHNLQFWAFLVNLTDPDTSGLSLDLCSAAVQAEGNNNNNNKSSTRYR